MKVTRMVNGLRADWGARGFWEAQQMALFDVRIFNPDSNSMANQRLEALFLETEREKVHTYSDAAEQRRASFTPFIATCNAALNKYAQTYIKRVALYLFVKWKTMHSVSRVTGWLRARIQICIL